MYSQICTLTAESQKIINSFSSLRETYTCEGQFINQLIWSDFYKTKYIHTSNALFYIMEIEKKPASMMPLCSTNDIVKTLSEMQSFFNEKLNSKLKIFLADKEFVSELKKHDFFERNYIIEECRDYFDYIYDAEKLRNLSGKKLHKKKNHLNAFVKEYQNVAVYKNICENEITEVKEFYESWLANKTSEDSYNRLEYEKIGIYKILDNLNSLEVRIGGIYIEKQLKAFSIGSLSPSLNQAVIHIEKADPNIRGLYNYINQQFLIHSFPNVQTVNREDDIGIAGLRHAKLSYNPIELVEKYILTQK